MLVVQGDEGGVERGENGGVDWIKGFVVLSHSCCCIEEAVVWRDR